ncbi:MAG: proline dehydrogenase family protein, partial [Pseudomonadota bacterium]
MIADFAKLLDLSAQQNASIDKRATRYVDAIRDHAGSIGGVEDFLREYGLSTPEGLAMMVLAEALLRVPDASTQDRLIEDKLKEGNWSEQDGHGDTWFVAASAWALGVTARVIKPGETPESMMHGLVKRLGLPTVRTATKQAMRFLGHHFVLGETIQAALDRAAKNEARGFRHSFDMLGEGARTAADAKRYWQSYADAIEAIGKAAGDRDLPERMGISVKLSALHPRYHATHRARVLKELVPSVLELAQRAKAHNLNFTVDAEEADRLELSLDVIAAVFADPSLAGWDGFGLAVQAYQKRAPQVIDFVDALCRHHDRKMMVRLVKGAYWDTEIKLAQERGLDDYPVYTRKAATDVSYLACARKMLDVRERIFAQFATHNALTVSMILEMAGNDRTGFEFQRLHGMGEALYDSVQENNVPVPCRIYAPVGGYRDLLAYLVRRLLENGANSSFVAVAGDTNVPVAELLERPLDQLGVNNGKSARHSDIPLPLDIYPDRRNSAGVE